jgi:uncharacterized membrane-anchored protein YjiN (DUF445 family)
MRSCIIDNRALIPEIKNQIGSVINDYVEGKVALVDDKTIVYKIETTEVASLAGFFAIKVDTTSKTATLLMKVLRPAFQQFDSIISVKISNFIYNNIEWQKDYLF